MAYAPATDLLLSILQDRTEAYTVREAAASALGWMENREDSVILTLIAALREFSAGDTRDARLVASWAARSLAHLRDPRGLEPLIELLANENNDMIRAGAYALGKLGNRRATRPLVEAMKQAVSDADDNVAFHVATALGELRDETAVETLINASENIVSPIRRDWEEHMWRFGDPARDEAIEALGKIGGPKAVQYLSKVLLEDTDVYDRRAAAVALATTGDREAVSPLIRALQDEEIASRYAAVKALAALSFEEAIPALVALLERENEHPWAQYSKGLRDLTAKTIDALQRSNPTR